MEYEGLPRPEATAKSHGIEVPRLRFVIINPKREGKSWTRLLPSASTWPSQSGLTQLSMGLCLSCRDRLLVSRQRPGRRRQVARRGPQQHLCGVEQPAQLSVLAVPDAGCLGPVGVQPAAQLVTIRFVHPTPSASGRSRRGAATAPEQANGDRHPPGVSGHASVTSRSRRIDVRRDRGAEYLWTLRKRLGA